MARARPMRVARAGNRRERADAALAPVRKRRDTGKCEGRKSHAERNPELVALVDNGRCGKSQQSLVSAGS